MVFIECLLYARLLTCVTTTEIFTHPRNYYPFLQARKLRLRVVQGYIARKEQVQILAICKHLVNLYVWHRHDRDQVRWTWRKQAAWIQGCSWHVKWASISRASTEAVEGWGREDFKNAPENQLETMQEVMAGLKIILFGMWRDKIHPNKYLLRPYSAQNTVMVVSCSEI